MTPPLPCPISPAEPREPPAPRCAWVYIVECADGSLYTGWSYDVAARVTAHNAGRGARYTRSRLPVRLLWSEAHPSRAAAMRREAVLKRLPRAAKVRLLAGGGVGQEEGGRIE